MLTQNKGEWSEFYAFLALLHKGEVQILDHVDAYGGSSQVRSVVKDALRFEVDDEVIKWRALEDGTPCFADRAALRKPVIALLEKIQDTAVRNAFSIVGAEEQASVFGISVKSRGSSSKADLSLSLVRHDTGEVSPDHPVSVKSWLGGNPTLFNSSKLSSRLWFEVIGVPSSEVSSIRQLKKARDRVKRIKALGGRMEFSRCEALTFTENLDTLRAAEAVAEAVLCHFSKAAPGKTSCSLIEAASSSPRKFKQAFREFLRACALGMTPAKVWNAENSASDNILVVDSQGDLLCLIGRGSLEQQLYKSAYLDTPSETRHDYGQLVEAEGRLYISLNFQIRLCLASLRSR